MKFINNFKFTKASILLEYLIGLVALACIVHLELLLMYQLHIDSNFDFLQDEIMIYKLNQQLMVSKIVGCSSNEISYQHHQEFKKMYFVNHRLIITPGTLVVLENVSGSFDCLKSELVYCRANKCRRVDLLYD